MADRKPIKVLPDGGGDSAGLAEFVAADTIGVVDGGTGLATVAASNILTGNGTSALSAESNLTFDGSTLTVTGALSATGNVSFDGGSFVFNETGANKDFRIEGDTQTHLFFADADADAISLRGTGNGATASGAQTLGIHGEAAFYRQENNAYGRSLTFAKSRGSDVEVVQDDDALGYICWAGADGTDLATCAAMIHAEIDGTPGSNDMPGRLSFSTTADGAAAVTERMRIHSTGHIQTGYAATAIVTMNDGINASNDAGLTIMQDGNDDEILSVKSSDVAHNMTDLTEADTYGFWKKTSTTYGGVSCWGFSEAQEAIQFQSRVTTEYTDKIAASGGAISFYAAKSNGSGGSTSHGTDANLLVIGDGGTGNLKFIFDQEGSGHADVEWTTYDAHDDLALISTMEDALLAMEAPDQTPRRHAMEATGIIGKGSWHMDNGKPKAMVNFTKLAMLHHGALIQTGDRFKILEDRLLATEEKLALAESKVKILEAN